MARRPPLLWRVSIQYSSVAVRGARKLPRINATVGNRSMTADNVSSGRAGHQSATLSIGDRIAPWEGRAETAVLPGAVVMPSLLATQDLFVPGGGDDVGIDRREVLDNDDVLIGL